jgi:predicted nucleotidyltransferase
MVCNMTMKAINDLQVSTNSLLNWLLQQKSLFLPSEPVWQLNLFRQQIRHTIALYPEGNQKTTLNLPTFEIPADPQFDPIRRLCEGFRQLETYVHTVLIHGSVATNEVVKNYSDVDILCILQPTIFENAITVATVRATLQKLEACLYEFDPCQHHGLQFITAADLQYYPEVLLPLEVIKHGRVIAGSQTLTIAVRDSTAEKESRFYGWLATFKEAAKAGVLHHHGKNGVYLQNNFVNAAEAFYQFKYFMSAVLLLPSLFIELIDQPIYKKESFTEIRNYFSDSELELLDACQAGRRLMPTLTLRDNAIPAELQAVIGLQYFERAYTFMQRLVAVYEVRQLS